ncbi:MAG: hypothetical protein GX548_08590 [Lentisphaerae bacterium]|nr:hypothetical protein [Lentisphaerota bacterium]
MGMDAEEKRIQKILGKDNDRTTRNAERYRDFLLKHLPLPVIVTGTEDFPWEEKYVFGGWSEAEYERLKKVRPSYTDTFELQALDPPDEHDDVVAVVKRMSDGQMFEIGLSWLCCEDEGSEAFELLSDYGIWHTNY